MFSRFFFCDHPLWQPLRMVVPVWKSRQISSLWNTHISPSDTNNHVRHVHTGTPVPFVLILMLILNFIKLPSSSLSQCIELLSCHWLISYLHFFFFFWVYALHLDARADRILNADLVTTTLGKGAGLHCLTCIVSMTKYWSSFHSAASATQFTLREANACTEDIWKIKMGKQIAVIYSPCHDHGSIEEWPASSRLHIHTLYRARNVHHTIVSI